MRYSVPHPIPYQGSKRRLAAVILGQIEGEGLRRLVEPFAGSAAVTLAAARKQMFGSYLLGDALPPLVGIWQSVIDSPVALAAGYAELWHRERARPIDAYYEIRNEFNSDRNPSKLLYLLARCVKNSVRFNPSGAFNQSPDKRRKGTNPRTMEAELLAAHHLLKDKTRAASADFMSLVEEAREGDFFYLDPPYQGTSEGRDSRYFEGVSRERVISALEMLNAKGVPFILSYDGFCGAQSYGEALPAALAHRILLDVGRSSQSTLSGRADVTVESLYLSRSAHRQQLVNPYSLVQLAPQASLFA